MVQEGDLLEATGQPAIYVIQGGLRHWIPDMATFYDNDFDPTKVKVISENELNAIPLGDPLPQSHRFVIDHETEMGANHFMATHGAMSSKTGQIHAQTETLTRTLLGGFNGGVGVIFLDHEGVPLPQDPPVLHVYGVDGKWIGNNDRIEVWSDTVSQYVVDRTVTLVISHTWAPQQFQQTVQKLVNTAKPVADLVQELAGIAKTSGLINPKQ